MRNLNHNQRPALRSQDFVQRRAGDADFHQCLNIAQSVWGGPPHPENGGERSARKQGLRKFVRDELSDAADFADLLGPAEDGRRRWHLDVLACRGDAPFVAGFVLYARGKMKVGHRAELRPFAVDPELWGLGLGRLMLDRLLGVRPRTPRRSAIRELTFDAAEADLQTQIFLHKAGFGYRATICKAGETFYRMFRRRQVRRRCEPVLEGGHD